MTVVVSDTSVLCYLAELGYLHLLERLYLTVLVPPEVLEECLHPHAPVLLRAALAPLPKYIQLAASNASLQSTMGLDKGEAAAIALAMKYQPSVLLLIDEKAGRRVASALGIPIRGILGLLAESHQRGWIDFEAAITQLAPLGFRVAPSLLNLTRQRLGLT
jgi:uncharacterized protein